MRSAPSTLAATGTTTPETSSPAATAAPTASDASPAPAASTVPDEPDSRAAARAKEWLGRLQKGTLDRSQLTADLNAGLQDATVAGLAKEYGPLGSPQKIVLREKRVADGTTTWIFHVTWPSQSLDYSFGIDSATGKISALYLRPGSTT